ncbi:MAG: M56 family metallopeptidase [Bacteroidota bacterium]
MNEFITILLKSSLSIVFLYLVYVLFMKKDTFFKTNRFYLISAMLISLIIPFIDFSRFFNHEQLTYAVLLDPVVITAEGVKASMAGNPGFYQILIAIYLTGVFIFTIRFIYQIVQLIFLIRRYGISKNSGMNIIFTDKTFSPFSFFNLIFLNSTDIDDSDTKKIIQHERIHIRQWHSADLILLEILTIFQWFNPFIWLYRHAIKVLHEFLADEGVLYSGVDVNVYSALLFEQSTGIQINDLTNNFSKSLLKRRFIMMNKKKTTQFARIKLLLVLPLAVSFMLVISLSPDVMAQEVKKSNSAQQAERVVKTPTPEDPPPPPKKIVKDAQKGQEEKAPIFTVVEEMPEFPGGQKALYEYMSENIQYPQQAKEKGISGTVFVSYVIEKDGSVSNIELLRGAEKSLDAEAIRVIKSMPDWKPGKQRGKAVRVQYNLPVKFTLDDKKKEEK